jgi:hypothetical protein
MEVSGQLQALATIPLHNVQFSLTVITAIKSTGRRCWGRQHAWHKSEMYTGLYLANLNVSDKGAGGSIILK